MGMDLGTPRPKRIASLPMKLEGRELWQNSEERDGPKRKWLSPISAPLSRHQQYFRSTEVMRMSWHYFSLKI